MQKRLKPALFFLISCLGVSLALQAGDSTSGTDDSAQSSLHADVERILGVSDDVAYGEYLASECASCHAKAPVPGSTVPVLYGLPPEYIVQAILEYREGIRDNTTMANVASSLGDEEIAVIAKYLGK